MLSDRILAALGDKARITTARAQYLGMANGAAVVVIGDSRISCNTGTYLPAVGEWVHVWVVDGVPFIYGPVALPLDPNVPPPPTPQPLPPANQVVQSQVFLPTDSGTVKRTGGDYYNPEVWASDPVFGVWCYGRKIKDTIPAAAEILGVQVRGSWSFVSGAAPRFMLHQLAQKTGLPTPSDTRPYPAVDDWIDLPPTWGDALKDGGAQWGVGLNQGGLNKAKSRIQDEWSGALKITWRV